MPRILLILLLLCLVPARAQQAQPGRFVPANLHAIDDRLWSRPGDRAALLAAIDRSLGYLRSTAAAAAYSRLHGRTGVSREWARRSLLRLRRLLLEAHSANQLWEAVRQEFVLFQPGGSEVHFTGYFEPLYAASRRPSALYRYPIFHLPPGFGAWPHPHPTRLQLEGADGLQWQNGPLRRAATFWLKDRLEAYLAQVEGSARLQLPAGQLVTVASAAHTDWPYASIGRMLVDAGKVRMEDLTQPWLVQYFHDHPADLSVYLPRNPRFVFFRETHGAPATGSIGVALTPERSIATDKAWMPPGALALIQVRLTNPAAVQVLHTPELIRFVLDQDAGSAIKGPARVDDYMGSGPAAGARAGVINSLGTLSYLLLRPLLRSRP